MNEIICKSYENVWEGKNLILIETFSFEDKKRSQKLCINQIHILNIKIGEFEYFKNSWDGLLYVNFRSNFKINFSLEISGLNSNVQIKFRNK